VVMAPGKYRTHSVILVLPETPLNTLHVIKQKRIISPRGKRRPNLGVKRRNPYPRFQRCSKKGICKPNGGEKKKTELCPCKKKLNLQFEN